MRLSHSPLENSRQLSRVLRKASHACWSRDVSIARTARSLGSDHFSAGSGPPVHGPQWIWIHLPGPEIWLLDQIAPKTLLLKCGSPHHRFRRRQLILSSKYMRGRFHIYRLAEVGVPASGRIAPARMDLMLTRLRNFNGDAAQDTFVQSTLRQRSCLLLRLGVRLPTQVCLQTVNGNSRRCS